MIVSLFIGVVENVPSLEIIAIMDFMPVSL